MNKYLQTAVFVVLVAVVIGLGWWYSQGSNQPANVGSASQNTSNTNNNMEGLQVKDIKVGTGAEAVAGKKVTVNYVGKLMNGTQFDSSYTHGQPFTFTLGAGQVIAGWDQGVAGMKVGGTRELVIPPQLGYGAQGAGGVIPPNATLDFTVELLNVQ